MRRLKPDPVPDDMIIKILEAGIKAPNGGNHQTWHLVVVKDMSIKKAVQASTSARMMRSSGRIMPRARRRLVRMPQNTTASTKPLNI